MKPNLYLMTGKPGAGKTTYAEEFARRDHIRYLGIDRFYAAINGDECNHINKFEVWIAFFCAIHMAGKEGVDIVVDTNAPDSYTRHEFVFWFPEFEHHLIWICTDDDQCKKNNLARTRVIPEDSMDKLCRSFENPAIDRKWKTFSSVINEENQFIRINTITRDGLSVTSEKIYEIPGDG